jgi:hypothetical protein
MFSNMNDVVEAFTTMVPFDKSGHDHSYESSEDYSGPVGAKVEEKEWNDGITSTTEFTTLFWLAISLVCLALCVVICWQGKKPAQAQSTTSRSRSSLGAHFEVLLGCHLVVNGRRAFGRRSFRKIRMSPKDGLHFGILQVDWTHKQETWRCSEFTQLEVRYTSSGLGQVQLGIQHKQVRLFTAAPEAREDFKDRSTYGLIGAAQKAGELRPSDSA